MAGIEDDAQALTRKVAGVVTEEALKTPRVARGITALEAMLQDARARGAAAAPASASLREDLAAVRRTLKDVSQGSRASLAGLLESRRSRRDQLSRSSGQPLQEVCSTLEASLEQLGVRVARLEAQVQENARTSASRPVSKSPPRMRPPQVGADPWKLALPTACGIALAALLAVAIMHSWRSPSIATTPSTPLAASVSAPPAPSHQDPWQALWGEALRQPAQCQENPKASTLLGCACPGLALSVLADLARRCPLQKDWPGPLMVAAMQAVLNVKQKNVWVDEHLGPALSDALQPNAFGCILPDEVETARQLLAGGSAEDAISPEIAKAALTLLEQLRRDPSCAR
jgi:hypothetical protein